jgi:hypothetical protein
VTSAVDTTTRDQLEAASVSTPPGDEEATTLPEGVPAIIRRTADRWTADADTPYAQALAIQNRLANGAFLYDEETPAARGYDGDGLGVIAEFLRVKAGYCIHYASTMAVMARLEGIPSRIVVGYQPGQQQNGTDLRRVSSDDLHAWPELYFDGIGWVRFEPTPGRGAVPAYAPLPTSDVTATPTATPTDDTTVAPDATSSDQAAAGGADDAGPILRATLQVVGTVLAIALLLALPGLARVLIRRRRIARLGRDGPAAAWRELLATATDLGVPSTRGLSPRGVEAVLARASGTSSAAQAALGRLRRAYELQAYSPDGASVVPDDLQRVLEALREHAGGARRFVATAAPRSLVGTIPVPRLAFRWSPPGSG